MVANVGKGPSKNNMRAYVRRDGLLATACALLSSAYAHAVNMGLIHKLQGQGGDTKEE